MQLRHLKVHFQEDAELMRHHLEMQHDDAMVEEKEAYIGLVE